MNIATVQKRTLHECLGEGNLDVFQRLPGFHQAILETPMMYVLINSITFYNYIYMHIIQRSYNRLFNI